jgi:DNA-binding CsgD family transcriptional regulator
LERLELTPREVDLPALLAGGLTNREIGTELFITNKRECPRITDPDQAVGP